jgi:hypothetical protein
LSGTEYRRNIKRFKICTKEQIKSTDSKKKEAMEEIRTTIKLQKIKP